MIELKSTAPSFSLKDQDNRTVKLANFKGRKVLLSFRPLAWTPICHDQMRSLEEHFIYLADIGVTPLGIGVDSSPSNKAWAARLGVEKLRLLSDFWPHGEVARSFGVFRENDGFSERANFIIDEQQKIVFAKVYPVNQVPDIHEIIEFLKK